MARCPKVGYANRMLALRALLEVSRKAGRRRKQEVRVYHCQCGRWHLTSHY